VAYLGWGGVQPATPLRNSAGPPKSCQTKPDFDKLWKIAEFRTPTHQDVRKKSSKVLKLLPVRNCFTLAMTTKLVVIINNLKVPKIKKISLYEMKFLIRNYSCLQNPWLGDYRPQIPVLSVLCPQLNLLNPPPPEQNSWVRHWPSTSVVCTLLLFKFRFSGSLHLYVGKYLSYLFVLNLVPRPKYIVMVLSLLLLLNNDF